MISNQLILHNFKTLFFNYYLNNNSNTDVLFYKKNKKKSILCSPAIKLMHKTFNHLINLLKCIQIVIKCFNKMYYLRRTFYCTLVIFRVIISSS